MTTKLAPTGLVSQMLALWFLATAVGDSVGGQLVRLIDVFGWAGYFIVCGIGTIIIGGLFLLVVPRIKRLMEAPPRGPAPFEKLPRTVDFSPRGPRRGPRPPIRRSSDVRPRDGAAVP